MRLLLRKEINRPWYAIDTELIILTAVYCFYLGNYFLSEVEIIFLSEVEIILTAVKIKLLSLLLRINYLTTMK